MASQSSGYKQPSTSNSIDTDEAVNDSSVGELGLPLPENHSPLPKFGNLHYFFQRLVNITGSGSVDRRKALIHAFIDSWRKQVGNDLYPFVRLWFSEEDDQLKQLRKVKDSMLAKLLVEALELSPTSVDALVLLDIRKVGNHRGFLWSSAKEDGFPLKAKEAIEKRYPQTEFSSLNVDDVAEKLVLFANSSKQERVAILKNLLDTMNSNEMYWVLKIIMGNVSLNCSVRTFLSLLHPDAEKVYLVNKNLKMVCHQLWSHDFQVSESDKFVHLCSHFFPMRAKYVKGTAEDMSTVVDLIEGTIMEHKEKKMDVRQGNKKTQTSGKRSHVDSNVASFYLEEKIDGVRIQLHWVRENDEIVIFSRNGKNHTLSYQSIFWDQPITDYYNADMLNATNSEEINLTQSKDQMDDRFFKSKRTFSMKDIVDDTINSCIIDGEIVAWDPETNDVCGQSKVRELASHQMGGRYRHLFLVFDVVHINGKVLTEEPLRTRKAQLEKLLPETKRHRGKGRVQILPYKLGHTASDISKEFNRVISQMSEGLVVKNPESIYQIDGRNNNWIKVKPEFVDGYQGENLDLVVAGCYWGNGKNANMLASYLCVVRDEKSDNRYVSLSRVGSGICLAMYNYINSLIEPHRFAATKPPSWLNLGNERAPDFYIDPQFSVVFEVKYSSISSVHAENSQSKLGYGAGYSLRFPRYVRLREDKDFKSSLTVEELLELHSEMPTGTAAKMKGIDSQSSQNVYNAAKKRKSSRIRQEGHIEPVLLTSHVFSGLTFYICGDITDPKFMTRTQLEKLVQEHGGTTTTFMKDAAAIPIADSNVTNAVKLIACGIYIIRPQYLFDCIENGRTLPFEPIHFLNNNSSNIASAQLVDKFGFSLYRRQNKREVQTILDKMDTKTLHYSNTELKDALNTLLESTPKAETANHMRAFLFSGLSFYIYDNSRKIFLIKNKIEYGDGAIVEQITDANFIIFDGKGSSLVNTGSAKVVSSSWVHECWKQCKLVGK